jgi:hypothetical protein
MRLYGFPLGFVWACTPLIVAGYLAWRWLHG